MAKVGIDLNAKAVGGAHEVCSEAWGGVNPYEIADTVSRGNPTWSYDQAKKFVALSILIYCPPTKGTVAR